MKHGRNETAAHEFIVPAVAEEWTDVATADVDAIKTSFSSAASAQSFSGSDLDGTVGTGTMDPPRNVTITTTSAADIDAVEVVITGTDVDGRALTDTITLTDAGNTTDSGTKAFATVTQVDIPAQSGTGGSIQIGFGAIIGLGYKAKDRAGEVVVLSEVEAGSIVATGTFATASASGPNGTYTPSTAPDGSNDYALVYEIERP